jgi:hypothetical protein
MNLLRPPRGISLSDWLAIVATTVAVYRGLIKSRHVLLDYMIELCELFGVATNPARPWPTFRNLVELIESRPKKAFEKLGQYQASLLNELKGFLIESSNCFNTCDGLPLSELSRPGHVFVLQLKNLETSVQQILISLIGIYHIIDQESQGKQNLPMQTCLIIDEAQMVLSRAKDYESPNGLTPLAHQLIQGRSSGTGVITVTHLPNQISTAVLSSAQTWCTVGGISDADNAYLVGKMMNLSSQALPILGKLSLGQMLVREIGREFKEPFLVDIDPPPLDKNAIDEESLQELMAFKRAEFPATPAKSLADYTRIDLDSAEESSAPATTANNPTPMTKSSKPAVAPSGPSLDQERLDILRDVLNCPDDFMKERRIRLHIKDYQHFNHLLEILEGQELVENLSVRIGSTEPTFTKLNDKGFAILRQEKPSNYEGKGSFLHAVLGRRALKKLNYLKWRNLKREFPIGSKGHLVDLYGISPEGVVTGCEITMSFSNVAENAVNSLIGSNLHRLVFLCCTRGDAHKVEALLKADPRVAP